MDAHRHAGPPSTPASRTTSTSAAGPFTPTGFARRDALRVRVDRPALVLALAPHVTRAHLGWVRGRVRDLSASGVAVEVAGLGMEPGQRLAVRVDGQCDGVPFRLELQGDVVRVAPTPSLLLYGVRLRAVTDRQRTELLEVVAAFARARRPV